MSAPAVQVRGMRKLYGQVRAVDGMDLDVEQGAVFGLLGPNGAGKSTTFGVLCGWLSPTAGSASVLGTPSRLVHTLRGRVTALPQDAAFPRNAPVRDELAHLARLTGLDPAKAAMEADRVLAAVELSDAARRRGRELSHGMLKRVGLAQALIGEPELVFLDEPTAGLDPASARHVKDLIASLAPKATVVLSSHNLTEVQEICTHGAILDHGRVIESGSIDELTRRSAEVAVEVRGDDHVPRRELEQAFGAANVAVGPQLVRVSFPAQQDAAEVIGRVLNLLLGAGVPVLGVRRGTSLEAAFLEATARSKQGRA